MNFFENFKKLINNSNDIEETEIVIVNNSDVSQEEISLAQKLDAIEAFTVDRIEDDIAVLEDRNNGKMIDVSMNELPEKIKSGDIIKRINGKYFIDEIETKSVEKRIEEKMNDLWN